MHDEVMGRRSKTRVALPMDMRAVGTISVD